MSRERSRGKASVESIEPMGSVGSIKEMLCSKNEGCVGSWSVVSAWIGDALGHYVRGQKFRNGRRVGYECHSLIKIYQECEGTFF